MSGYLQRLARSVSHPAETIHPMLGSVYSPASYGSTDDTLEQNVTVTSLNDGPAPQSPEAAEPRQQSALLPPVQPSAASPVRAAESAYPESTPCGPPALTPLVRAAPSQSPAGETSFETAIAVKQTESSTDRGYAPLMIQAPPRPASVLSPRAQPTAAASRNLEPSSPRQAEHEPDEIQIHIGRIEVTAVQQAPARAPLKTLHKGQSLDEYLKRRDRRA